MRTGSRDKIRRALAATCYVAGVAAVLYVAVFLPFEHPEQPQAALFISHWPWYVAGMALVVVAALLWPKRNDSGHSGAE